MTDSRKTDPAPAPKSTVPPHVDCARLGMAIVGIEDIARYLGSKLDGDLAEFANEVVTKVYEKQAAFESEVRQSLRSMSAELGEMNGKLGRLMAAFEAFTAPTVKAHGTAIANIQAHCAEMHLAPLHSVAPPDEAKAE